jgi:hypothetical protein
VGWMNIPPLIFQSTDVRKYTRYSNFEKESTYAAICQQLVRAPHQFYAVVSFYPFMIDVSVDSTQRIDPNGFDVLNSTVRVRDADS